MNYYEHHIGDYDADTSHLTWLEDMAYTRLLRLYYRREKPIPADVSQACRLVRASSKDERKAVELVLGEFFVLGSEGWVQSRCKAEVEAYQKKVEHNQRVGKLGGRPRKIKTQVEQNQNPPVHFQEPEQNPPGYFREPEQNPPQTPDPRPQTGIHSDAYASGGASLPPSPPAITPPVLQKQQKAMLTDPAEIIFGYGLGLLAAAGTKEAYARSFLGLQRKVHGDAVLIDTLRKCAKAKPLQPLEWIAAALPPPLVAGVAGKPNKQEALEARNKSIADEWAAEGGETAQNTGDFYEAV